MVASVRAYSNLQPGRHLLQAAATQSDGAVATASGEFEVIDIGEPRVLRAKNIIMLGDGMGASHRTAARIVQNGYTQGKAQQPLAGYPRNNTADRATLAGRPLQLADGFFIAGQVPGDQDVHTGGDIPLSAFGRDTPLFHGTVDNADVYSTMLRAAFGVEP